MSTVRTLTGAAGLLLSVLPASGGSFTVNTLPDAPAVDPIAGPDSDAATPGDQITLRSAVQHINTLPADGSYTILLPEADIELTIEGAGEDDAATGDLDIRRHLTIQGAGVGDSFVLGRAGDRALDIHDDARVRLTGFSLVEFVVDNAQQGGAVRTAPDSALELEFMEIRDCAATGGPEAHGGAVYAAGSLFLGPETWMNTNEADGHGGAIAAFGSLTVSGGDLRDGVSLWQNHAARSGGAIYLAPGAAPAAIHFAMIDGNTSGETGGAVELHAPAELTDLIFDENTSPDRGGAIRAAADATLARVVAQNNASGTHGGALAVEPGVVVSVRDSVLEANAAGNSGGAVANAGSVRMTGTSLLDNQAGPGASARGGAIANDAALTLLNCTLIANTAGDGSGGAIDNTGQATLIHVTCFDDVAAQGSTIHNAGQIETTHSVFAPGSGPGIAGVSLNSLGYNLDADGSAGLAGPGDLAGTPADPIDPMLGFLDNNPVDGPDTVTLTPLPGSPCRDAGDAGFSVDDQGQPVLSDQRDLPRPIGRPDIGAVELCPADIARPFGQLDQTDVQTFISAFGNGTGGADLAAPFGTLNFFDVAAFFNAYGAGCD
jgi:predicted outer membrane repeat protein